MKYTTKQKKIQLMTLLIILAAVLVTSCVPTEKQCTTDAECVPTTCCHPTDAVNKNFGPDCRGQFCSLECEPNTLDCGQGDRKSVV